MYSENLCADDTKLFCNLKSPEGTEKLQQDLDNLVEWSRQWQLGFNEAKCKVLHLGTANTRHQYAMNNTLMEATPDEKDLGVVIDKKFKFHLHVSQAVTFRQQLSPAWIRQQFQDCSPPWSSSRVWERNLAPKIQT